MEMHDIQVTQRHINQSWSNMADSIRRIASGDHDIIEESMRLNENKLKVETGYAVMAKGLEAKSMVLDVLA